MSDSDFEDDLKLAIALSLQKNDSNPPVGRPKSKSAPVVIDLLSSDDEDEDDLDAPVIIKKKPIIRSAFNEESSSKPKDFVNLPVRQSIEVPSASKEIDTTSTRASVSPSIPKDLGTRSESVLVKAKHNCEEEVIKGTMQSVPSSPTMVELLSSARSASSHKVSQTPKDKDTSPGLSYVLYSFSPLLLRIGL